MQRLEKKRYQKSQSYFKVRLRIHILKVYKFFFC